MSDSGIKKLIENNNPAVLRARIATLEAERDEALRMLADERAAWIEMAIEHNKQCKQLNPGPAAR